jgi:hypothetical protein
MSILQKLNEIITSRHCVAYLQDAVMLTDDEPQSECGNTTVRCGDGKMLVCKFDQKGFEKYPFLKHESGIQEMCDYLIFYAPQKSPDKLHILVCEMQSKSKPDKKAIAQMRAGYNLGCFLVETAKRLMDYQNTESNIKFGGVRLSTRPPSKYLKMSDNDGGRKDLIASYGIKYIEMPCGEPYNIDTDFV